MQRRASFAKAETRQRSPALFSSARVQYEEKYGETQGSPKQKQTKVHFTSPKWSPESDNYSEYFENTTKLI